MFSEAQAESFSMHWMPSPCHAIGEVDHRDQVTGALQNEEASLCPPLDQIPDKYH
jgi:hypothetical protein